MRACASAQLALAREFGATRIDVESETRSRRRELTGGKGADVVVDVSSYSTAPSRRRSTSCARGPRGRGREGFKAIPTSSPTRS